MLSGGRQGREDGYGGILQDEGVPLSLLIRVMDGEPNIAGMRSHLAGEGTDANVIEGLARFTPGDQVATRDSLSEEQQYRESMEQELNTASEPSSDAQLVKRAQCGDKRAFEMLVIKYQGRIASIVSRFVSDRQDILDICQETFIKAYKNLQRFRGDSAFYTWLYRIAVNTAKNFLAANGRKVATAALEPEEALQYSSENRAYEAAGPDAQLQKDEVEKVLMEAWQNLPAELNVALTLRERDGMSYDEIAQVMDCPVGTVRSRIFRARDMIERAIAPLLETKIQERS